METKKIWEDIPFEPLCTLNSHTALKSNWSDKFLPIADAFTLIGRDIAERFLLESRTNSTNAKWTTSPKYSLGVSYQQYKLARMDPKGARRGGRAGLPCRCAHPTRVLSLATTSPPHGELARPQRGEAE